MPKERDILKILFQNFINSLRPKQIKGNLMGKDRYGNQYFEVPADPSVGKRKPSRWFTPSGNDELSEFDREMPAEWEAWLRGRRPHPPSEEEIFKNKAIADLKKENAAKLGESQVLGLQQTEIKDTPTVTDGRTKPAQSEWPTYKEYETRPGDHLKDEDARDSRKERD